MRIPLKQVPTDLENNPSKPLTPDGSSLGSEVSKECINRGLCPALMMIPVEGWTFIESS